MTDPTSAPIDDVPAPAGRMPGQDDGDGEHMGDPTRDKTDEAPAPAGEMPGQGQQG